MDGPPMADQETCFRRSGGTRSASTYGRMCRSPFSVASIPFAMESTIMPGFKSEANCSPAQCTPKELTPLRATSAPSKASLASSSWYARTVSGTLQSRPGCHPVFFMLSMMSRSRWVPTSRTSWPLSASGKLSAVDMMPDPRTLTVVIVFPPKSQNKVRTKYRADQTSRSHANPLTFEDKDQTEYLPAQSVFITSDKVQATLNQT